MGRDDKDGDELTVISAETLAEQGSFLIERKRLERRRIIGEGNDVRWTG